MLPFDDQTVVSCERPPAVQTPLLIIDYSFPEAISTASWHFGLTLVPVAINENHI